MLYKQHVIELLCDEATVSLHCFQSSCAFVVVFSLWLFWGAAFAVCFFFFLFVVLVFLLWCVGFVVLVLFVSVDFC